MAAPVGHLTIKSNNIKFNNLGLLINDNANTEINDSYTQMFRYYV